MKYAIILLLVSLTQGCTWNTDLNDSGTKRVQTFTNLFSPNLSIYTDDEVQMQGCPPPPGICTTTGYSAVYAGTATVGQISNAAGLIVGATLLRPSMNVSNNTGGYGGNSNATAGSTSGANSNSTFNLNGVPQ